MPIDLSKRYHDLFAKKAHDDEAASIEEAKAAEREKARLRELHDRFAGPFMSALEAATRAADKGVAGQGSRFRVVPTSFDRTLPATAVQLAEHNSIKMRFLNIHLEPSGTVVFVAAGDLDEHQKRAAFRREAALDRVSEDDLSALLFDFVRYAIGA